MNQRFIFPLFLVLLIGCAQQDFIAAQPAEEVVLEQPPAEVAVEKAPVPEVIDEKQPEIVAEPAKKPTEAEVKEIALKRVPGKITDFDVESKFGKPTYVVEIRPDKGPETDVIIDMDTGEVLGIET